MSTEQPNQQTNGNTKMQNLNEILKSGVQQSPIVLMMVLFFVFGSPNAKSDEEIVALKQSIYAMQLQLDQIEKQLSNKDYVTEQELELMLYRLKEQNPDLILPKVK